MSPLPCETADLPAPTEQSLLEAIVANPDDDDARLVYADILETRGDPRGEFIQLQCRRSPDAAITARIDELLAQHTRTWLADLLALKLGATFVFERGFVAAMSAHFPAATTQATALLARAPLLERLDLTVHGQLDRVQLARPKTRAVLARAKELSIRGRHAGNTRGGRGPIADLRALASTPFTRLQRLQLVSLRTQPDQLIELMRSPHLATLEWLGLGLRMPPDERARLVPVVEDLKQTRPSLQISF